MAYRITPKPFEDDQKLDLPGPHPTHHRAKMPNGGGVIPEKGIVVTELHPHNLSQMLRGEVDIHELDKEGEPVRKLHTAAEQIAHKEKADAEKAARDAEKAEQPGAADHHEEQ